MHTPHFLTSLLSGYAAILFTERPIVGLLFLSATFGSPFVGLSGLLCASVALLTTECFQFSNLKNNQAVYNGILLGLSLGVSYTFNMHLFILLLLAGFGVAWITTTFVDFSWRLSHLPVLSLPFVITAFPIHFIAKQYATNGVEHLSLPGDHLFPLEILNTFFTALGATFFSPHPLIGVVIFVGIVWSSRYLAFLAVAGFSVGFIVFTHFAHSPPSSLFSWTAFNCILTSMALGGIFTIPERRSLGMALMGAALAALMMVAMKNILLNLGPLTFVLPFLLSTFFILIGLQKRLSPIPPYLTLEHPQLPEASYKHYRLEKARQTPHPESIALSPPFYGTWHIYQGFYGPHTHQPPWQYALDFFILNGERSFKNQGTELLDYFCFGLPVLSPCSGIVLEAQDHLPDNIPGEANLHNPWGNHILIKLEGGRYVLLAHLKQTSIQVAAGKQIYVGQILAACGNSGRSLQPHLHLQVQTLAALGSATLPFHLSAVASQAEEAHEPYFYPVLCPKKGASIQTIQKNSSIAACFHFPAGRTVRFRFKQPAKDWIERQLKVELTLDGRFRLVSDKGAHCFFEETEHLCLFHNTLGGRDPFLDIFILSLSMTPYAEYVPTWKDHPSALLIPFSFWQRALFMLVRPLDPGLMSQYRRAWNDENKCWHQFGEHRLKIFLNWHVVFYTHVEFYDDPPVMRLSARCGKKSWTLELLAVGQLGDLGIPKWEGEVKN
ncbi:MAG: urea transporter [Gammaproteobacteria bacterium]|nr:urea transporter [Gammaproteobacteria bacterium]